MATNPIDYASAVIDQVTPDAASVLGVYNQHVVANFRAGSVSAASILSTFRLAKLVTGEPSPLILTKYKFLQGSP